MTILEKLNLMKRIDADNKAHVEAWKKAQKKIWVADYGYIDADGTKVVETMTDGFGQYRIQIEAPDIQTALDEAKKMLLKMSVEKGWQEVRIYDIGICNENIW